MDEGRICQPKSERRSACSRGHGRGKVYRQSYGRERICLRKQKHKDKEEYIYTYTDEEEYIDTDTDEEECSPTDTYEQEYTDIDKKEQEHIDIDKKEQEHIDIDKDKQEYIDIYKDEQGHIDTSTDEEEYRADEQEYIDTDFDDEDYVYPPADEEEYFFSDMDEEEHFHTDKEDTEDDSEQDTDQDESTTELEDDLFFALSKMVSNLCSICRQFPRGRIYSREIRTYHPSLSSLKVSVDAGCSICENIARFLDQFCQESEPQVTPSDWWSIKCRVSKNHGVSVYAPNGNGGRGLILAFYFSNCECGHPSDASCEHAQRLGRRMCFYPARELGLGPEFLDPTLKTTTAKSATSIGVCRSWYRQCLDHTNCRNWKLESRALPTRLIQIRKPKNEKSGISANICETKDLPLSTPYATLSHCWGSGVIFTLLKANLEELSQEIPIRQLPKVFQDAMHVSIEMDVCYIWIDSLCIIQDSKEDWMHESKRMGEVYLYAEFNIAADGYGDGLPGLFNERRALPREYPPLRLECVVTGEDGSKCSFDGIYVPCEEEEFIYEVAYSDLNDRAWVAQERFLAPAIIHYTPGKVWWECSHLIANEAFTPRIALWGDLSHRSVGRIRSLNKKSAREDVYSFWREFLDQYPSAALTFEQDRFPAAAGIARAIGELIDDNLIAGIWEGDLVRSLVMYRAITRRSIPTVQVAPSWSWASSIASNSLTTTDGKESTIEPLTGVNIRILSDIPGFKSDLQLTSLEKSGVRGLAIRGPLRSLIVDFDKRRPEYAADPFVNYDNKRPARFTGVLTKDQMWRWDDPTHMLLLAKAEDCTSWCACFGLLVQPVPEADEPNTFRRSGSINLTFRTEDELEEYLGLRKKDGEYEASVAFEERGLQELILI